MAAARVQAFAGPMSTNEAMRSKSIIETYHLILIVAPSLMQPREERQSIAIERIRIAAMVRVDRVATIVA